MKRREFLEAVAGDRGPQSAQGVGDSPRGTRPLVRTTSGIEPYIGGWSTEQASHLLRRTVFGPRRAEILLVTSGPLSSAVGTLLADQPDPEEPKGPAGVSWVDAVYDTNYGQNEGTYRNYLKAWWLGLMVQQGISIREKMVLFWHNHFANEATEIRDARSVYRQNALFRRMALGNFKQLVKEITLDPAMLVYLNGYLNRGGGNNIPDENYARELLELFTIGKGPQIAEGNYTHYTETDVKAAARVLTGYRVTGSPRDRNYLNQPLGSLFDPARHDATNKQFSPAFQNTVITGKTGANGAAELDDLLTMIFAQPETARHLCRKLYRWFVYYDIDDQVEQNVIAPLAQIMIDSGYEVKPVIDVLLKSAHFFDENNIGCFVKTPMDLVAGSVRQFPSASLPDLSSWQNYALGNSFRATGANLQMNLFDPPDVAGWKAFYQNPDFYQSWINTATLPSRGGFTDSLVNGVRAGTTRFSIDVLAFVKTLPDPADPFKMLDGLASEVSPIALTANQKDYLMYSVLGLTHTAEYEWTQRWNTYLQDPTTQNTNNVLTPLNTLIKFMLRMAEFQLA
ncbi:MAG: DUF1800 domain-containing protein [Bacteroidota bacterium]